MRSTEPQRRAGWLVALVGVVALLAACTDDGTRNDVRSPAPTGSLTPASSAEASPSAGGDVSGDAELSPAAP
ncbi:MAG: hypothetical protein HY262_08995 [Chloroflexi bacterium]|nr:hypothetical protein [Chloroflexota bacterium]